MKEPGQRTVSRQRRGLRAFLHSELDPTARIQHLSFANKLLAAAIVLATLVAIIRTEPDVARGNEAIFDALDLCFGAMFMIEYVLRSWTIVENARYRGPLGRLKFAFAPGSVIDAVAILATLAPFFAANLLPLRILRLAALIRVAKLGRLSSAMRRLGTAVMDRRYELMLTGLVAMVGMVAGATLMWWAEGEVQPDKFGSIPRAMWWAAVTLTTIGYGDVYPITAIGKTLSVCMAVIGIGLIAMPTGILAAAFSDALHHDGEVQESSTS